MYKTKIHKTSKSLSPVYIEMFVVKWVFFFSDVFINHFPKIYRSVLYKITVDLSFFWDDDNLWEKLAITVKRRFIETRLNPGCDLQGYVSKIEKR